MSLNQDYRDFIAGLAFTTTGRSAMEYITYYSDFIEEIRKKLLEQGRNIKNLNKKVNKLIKLLEE